MPKTHRPRAGSLQFWPRKRARRIYPRVRNWLETKSIILLGFAGYKAGMTDVLLKDIRSHSRSKNEEIVWPVTVIECPPIKLVSIKLYKNTPYGRKTASQVFVLNKFDKELARKLKLPKNYDAEKKLTELKLENVSDVVGVFHTQPKTTGLPSKKPEVFEIGVGGNDIKHKLDYLKNLIGKEVRVSDVFKPLTNLDIHAVTKGKGLQGVVKRMGVTLKSHKSEKGQRRAVLGPEGYRKVKFSAPSAGQMGYHNRTEYNKELLLIGNDPKQVNPKGGFLHYGLIKNDFILVKGSIAGPAKRLIRLTEPSRGKINAANVEIRKINTESKQ